MFTEPFAYFLDQGSRRSVEEIKDRSFAPDLDGISGKNRQLLRHRLYVKGAMMSRSDSTLTVLINFTNEPEFSIYQRYDGGFRLIASGGYGNKVTRQPQKEFAYPYMRFSITPRDTLRFVISISRPANGDAPVMEVYSPESAHRIHFETKAQYRNVFYQRFFFSAFSYSSFCT
jgi:hypothetical protein